METEDGLGFHTFHNKLSTASCVSSVLLCVCFFILNSLCRLYVIILLLS